MLATDGSSFSAGLKIQRSGLDVFGTLRITNQAERYFRHAPLDLKSCGYFDN
jgi:hypothetical protein